MNKDYLLDTANLYEEFARLLREIAIGFISVEEARKKAINCGFAEELDIILNSSEK